MAKRKLKQERPSYSPVIYDPRYSGIEARPAEARTVTLYCCPDCGPEKGRLVSHLNGKPIERKRSWPKGCNYFACKNCRKPLWVEIESWD